MFLKHILQIAQLTSPTEIIDLPTKLDSLSYVEPSPKKKPKKMSTILPKQESPKLLKEDVMIEEMTEDPQLPNDTITNAMEQCGLPPNDMPMIFTPVKSTLIGESYESFVRKRTHVIYQP